MNTCIKDLILTWNPLKNFCGLDYLTIDCNSPCTNGLNTECPTGKLCFNNIDHCFVNPLISNSTADNFCGKSFNSINCTHPCPSGLNTECPFEYACFNRQGFCKNSSFNLNTDPTLPPANISNRNSLSFLLLCVIFMFNMFL
jgi:hypothetical protein